MGLFSFEINLSAEASDVNLCGAAHSADLGGSSKYSYETYED